MAFKQKQKLPIALIIVSVLFMLNGLASLVKFIHAIVNTGSFNIDLSAINILAGIRLLQLKQGWRIYCMVILALLIISTPVVAYFAWTGAPLELGLLWIKLESGSVPLNLAFSFLLFSLALWQMYTLWRSDTALLFEVNQASRVR